jgi:hypothetical protein
MKREIAVLAFVLLLLSGTATGEEWPFRMYPAEVFHGKPVVPKPATPMARSHISRIRAAVRRGPNFGGHYTVVGWGCGTSCEAFVILDYRTGKIYEPPEISRGVDLGIAGPVFKPDSSLMVVASCPLPEIYGLKNCERKFYRWDGERLLVLKKEPVTRNEKGSSSPNE